MTLPDPTTTGSGSVASGPSGDSLGMPPEIASGPESTAISRLNAVDVRPRLVCFPGRCHNSATHVVFFEMGDARTYCDEHGPNLNGPAHLRILAVARLV